jgi:hypothetical protein
MVHSDNGRDATGRRAEKVEDGWNERRGLRDQILKMLRNQMKPWNRCSQHSTLTEPLSPTVSILPNSGTRIR